MTRAALTVALLIAATAIVASGCGKKGDVQKVEAGPAEYVALGESYTAGVGLEPKTLENIPEGCRQSSVNYPHLVNEAEKYSSFKDASCGSATFANLTASQQTQNGTNPAQFERLDKATKIVTIGMGGNDAGFPEVADTCLHNTDPSASPCEKQFVSSAGNELDSRAALVEAQMKTALTGIHERSPNAKVFVASYRHLLPDDLSKCAGKLGISPTDAKLVNAWIASINDSLETAAKSTGATYVDLYTPSEGHDACEEPGTRWIEPVNGAVGEVLHPNKLGHEEAAKSVEAAIAAN
jgi:lysophospholipase L1-like esterase